MIIFLILPLDEKDIDEEKSSVPVSIMIFSRDKFCGHGNDFDKEKQICNDIYIIL